MSLQPAGSTDCTCGIFPPSWSRTLTVLCPVHGDARDTSIDVSRLDALKRSRETPLFKGCDDEDAVVEEFLIIPQIHVRVRTTGREKTRQDPRLDRCKIYVFPLMAIVQMFNAGGATAAKGGRR